MIKETAKKHSVKILVFIINGLFLVIGILLIKDKHITNQAQKAISETALQPIDLLLLETQQKIMVDRENKLRDANTTPQKIISKQVTTDTKTTTTPKSSSSSSSSSSKTKTS